VILIDTHILVWWTSNPERLRRSHYEILRSDERFAVSVISCWEVAKLVQHGRLELDRPVLDWIASALAQHDLELLPLTPTIALESTKLPDPFHRDPADQIIVATARIHEIPLLTEDSKIIDYPCGNMDTIHLDLIKFDW
jgi:PIN domain nuclease of toxin-antitoxin system